MSKTIPIPSTMTVEDVIDDEYYDQVSIPSHHSKPPVTSSFSKPPQSDSKPKSPTLTYNLNQWARDHYLLEYLSAIMIFLFAVNYIVGSKENRDLAISFAMRYYNTFTSQFKTVGTDGIMMIKESQHSYRFVCSGHPHCIGLQGNLILNRRQDLFQRIYAYWENKKDVLELKFVLPENFVEPLIVAIVKNLDLHSIVRLHQDLELYPKPVKSIHSGLYDRNWSILSDYKDVVPDFITRRIKELCTSHSQYLTLIHLTDRFNNQQYKNVLHFLFVLPDRTHIDDLEPLFSMAFHLLEHVPKLVLSASARAAQTKLRSTTKTREEKVKLEEHREFLQSQKQEKQRKVLESMTLEQREQFEKKELNKSMYKNRVRITN